MRFKVRSIATGMGVCWWLWDVTDVTEEEEGAYVFDSESIKDMENFRESFSPAEHKLKIVLGE